jgi:hypothetical protein
MLCLVTADSRSGGGCTIYIYTFPPPKKNTSPSKTFIAHETSTTTNNAMTAFLYYSY